MTIGIEDLNIRKYKRLKIESVGQGRDYVCVAGRRNTQKLIKNI